MSTPPAIPRGVADYFGGPAVARRQAESLLRDLAWRWGFGEVIPPTFEYAETLATEAGTQIAEEMYRFLDGDGRALALRPDLTIPTARLAGSKLYDQPLPLRFFYSGPVFRNEEPRAGRQREFWQVGVELIGASGPDADAEVLAFAAQALQAMDLPVIRFTLGHLGYFHGLVEHLRLNAEAQRALQSALDRKSGDDLARWVQDLALAGADAAAVLGLLGLAGEQGQGVLARAQAVALCPRMAEAVERLHAVERRLEHYGVKQHFAIDLTDVRGMDYYTGITFKAYTSHIGSAIVNGGRYDNLVGHFGPPQPAVGCAIYLDRVLLAAARRVGSPPDPTPDLLVAPCDCGAYARYADEARSAGMAVAVVHDSAARLRPPARLLRCGCDGGVRLEGPAGSLTLAARDWLDHLC